MGELKEIVRRYTPQVIAVTETWGNMNIEDKIFELEKYSMYRTDRIGGGPGGTIIYVTNDLGQRECKALNRPGNGVPFDSSTWCWVTPTNGKKVLIGCIYRSPSSLTVNNDKLLKLINQANDIAGGSRLLILGDFNVPYIDWENRFPEPRARKVEKDFCKQLPIT